MLRAPRARPRARRPWPEPPRAPVANKRRARVPRVTYGQDGRNPAPPAFPAHPHCARDDVAEARPRRGGSRCLYLELGRSIERRVGALPGSRPGPRLRRLYAPSRRPPHGRRGPGVRAPRRHAVSCGPRAPARSGTRRRGAAVEVARGRCSPPAGPRPARRRPRAAPRAASREVERGGLVLARRARRARVLRVMVDERLRVRERRQLLRVLLVLPPLGRDERPLLASVRTATGEPCVRIHSGARPRRTSRPLVLRAVARLALCQSCSSAWPRPPGRPPAHCRRGLPGWRSRTFTPLMRKFAGASTRRTSPSFARVAARLEARGRSAATPPVERRAAERVPVEHAHALDAEEVGASTETTDLMFFFALGALSSARRPPSSRAPSSPRLRRRRRAPRLGAGDGRRRRRERVAPERHAGRQRRRRWCSPGRRRRRRARLSSPPPASPAPPRRPRARAAAWARRRAARSARPRPLATVAAAPTASRPAAPPVRRRGGAPPVAPLALWSARRVDGVVGRDEGRGCRA